MKLLRLLVLAGAMQLLLWGVAPARGWAQTGFTLPNPSFEEDYENDGVPDGWTLPNGSGAHLTRDRVSDGIKAAECGEGYVVLAHDQTLTRLAGSRVTIELDAAGEGGAELGMMVAYHRRLEDGRTEFTYSRITWDRPLGQAYQRLSLGFSFAPNAVDGRVWLGLYRSNRQGTLYLDNVAVVNGEGVSAEKAAALARIHREWSYLHQAATEAAGRLDDASAVDAILQAADTIARRSLRQDPALLANPEALQQQRRGLYAELYRLQAGGRPLVVSWSGGTARMDPAAGIPASLRARDAQTLLPGTYQALGVTVWNTRAAPVTLAVAVEGLDAVAEEVVVRRQVFLENWYDKEKTRTADALPRLARERGAWQLPLEAGEAARLYIGYRSRPDAAGEHPVTVSVRGDGPSAQRLHATLEVQPAPLPTTPRLHHWQCIYMDLLPAGRYPELAARDLASHYVTAAQFPYAPEAEFDHDGHLLTHDFASTRQARWMRAYAPHIDKLWLFWEGSLLNAGLQDRQGRKIPVVGTDGRWTPAFRTAFAELLRAWLDFAAAEGFGVEHWAIVPDDEPHSGAEWAQAPGPAIRRAVELFELVRRVEPGLQIQVTLGNYALPEDVKMLLPQADAALPIHPYPEQLVRWAPPGYNPAQAYEQTIGPMLMRAHREEGLQVWSYRVSRGIKDELLGEVLSYPVQAVARGYTGIGYWAYNVTRGRSWDDRDGGLLDYSFIYNGLEDHPLNRRYNVTGEVIVPSIRWEALRLGFQHGQVLLYLKDLRDRGRCPAEYQREVEALLERAEVFSPKPAANDPAEYDAFADRLLRVYVRVWAAVGGGE